VRNLLFACALAFLVAATPAAQLQSDPGADVAKGIPSPTGRESNGGVEFINPGTPVLSDAELNRLRDGVELADGPTRPAVVTRVRDSAKSTHFEITLTEGRNRQVRRMVEALGARVLELVRVRVGGISIGKLPIGKWRLLTRSEVSSLRHS